MKLSEAPEEFLLDRSLLRALVLHILEDLFLLGGEQLRSRHRIELAGFAVTVRHEVGFLLEVSAARSAMLKTRFSSLVFVQLLLIFVPLPAQHTAKVATVLLLQMLHERFRSGIDAVEIRTWT